jgi:hypothetical protein
VFFFSVCNYFVNAKISVISISNTFFKKNEELNLVFFIVFIAQKHEELVFSPMSSLNLGFNQVWVALSRSMAHKASFSTN